MTDSRMPLVDAYLAGQGDLDAAAAELIGFMPLHGSLFGKDPAEPPPAEVEERGRVLIARVRVLLSDLRAADDGGARSWSTARSSRRSQVAPERSSAGD